MSKDIRDTLLILGFYGLAFIGLITILTLGVSYIHDHIWLYNQMNP